VANIKAIALKKEIWLKALIISLSGGSIFKKINAEMNYLSQLSLINIIRLLQLVWLSQLDKVKTVIKE